MSTTATSGCQLEARALAHAKTASMPKPARLALPFALALLVLGSGCQTQPSRPAGFADWQWNLVRATRVMATYGRMGEAGFEATGEARPLTEVSLGELRTALAKPASKGPFLCLYQIESRLKTGDTEVLLSSGCDIMIVQGSEYAIERDDALVLKSALVHTLGLAPAGVSVGY
jgi:hypothetical protein